MERNLGMARADLSQRDYAAMVEALRNILEWVLGKERRPSCVIKSIGRRTIALAWTVAPTLFEGTTLTHISRQLGISHQAMSSKTASLRVRYGIYPKPKREDNEHARKE